jgi:hypothetical protein
VTQRRHHHPKPDDEEISKYLESKSIKDFDECQAVLVELAETIFYTFQNEEPKIFAYGRLLNYLTDGVERETLTRICAAALWKLYGQNNAEIKVIPQKARLKRNRKGK